MPLFLLLWAFASQQNSGGDVKTLLLEVRKHIVQTVDSLPKYLCTETVERVTFRPDSRLKSRSCEELESGKNEGDFTVHRDTSDRLRLDVAVSGDREMYSWVADGRFDNRSLAELVRQGATATSSFASLIASIFIADSATFTYNGNVNSDGQLLAEFGFHVPVEKSAYIVHNGLHRAVVGYHGTFWVDPKTLDLMQLTVNAEQIPDNLITCESKTTLTYNNQVLNRPDFLIPREVRSHVVKFDGAEFYNRTVFSGCREFLGESTLRFDDEPVSASRLPPQLPFSISLANPIQTATAAAGDLFQAKLTTAIKGKRNEIYVPNGAPVTGRIVRIERRYASASQSLVVAFKLETVEVNGLPQPFHAYLGSAMPRHKKPGTFDQLSGQPDPAVGLLRFEQVTDNYVIGPGLTIEGRTGN